MTAMYQAIVFLPLLGAVIAGLIALVGARARHPGGIRRRRMTIMPQSTTRSLRTAKNAWSRDRRRRLASRRARHHHAAGARPGCCPGSPSSTSAFGHDARVPLFNLITSGDLKVDWALRIDTLTAVMLVVVTTVSALVHLYSIGYMADDPHQPRFFAYLSLFTFAMLMLVTADNWCSCSSAGKAWASRPIC